MEFYMTVHSVGNNVVPTDELHHLFRGVGIPPTSDNNSMYPIEITSYKPFGRGFHGQFL